MLFLFGGKVEIRKNYLQVQFISKEISFNVLTKDFYHSLYILFEYEILAHFYVLDTLKRDPPKKLLFSKY